MSSISGTNPIEYRSGIYFHSPEQEQIAKQVTKEVQDMHLKGRPIVTEIAPMKKWWPGEAYHQQYCKSSLPQNRSKGDIRSVWLSVQWITIPEDTSARHICSTGRLANGFPIEISVVEMVLSCTPYASLELANNAFRVHQRYEYAPKNNISDQ